MSCRAKHCIVKYGCQGDSGCSIDVDWTRCHPGLRCASGVEMGFAGEASVGTFASQLALVKLLSLSAHLLLS
jgi:hypothetical protein